MPAIDLDRIKEHGKRFVDGFTPGQKAMTILGVIAVVLGGMMFMKWAAAADYAPLYTGLSSQDAGAVTQELQSSGVKYKIAGGGETVLVPAAVVDSTRIALSAKGIPSGGDSYSLLDKQGITTDQFTRNIDYQRALQGELGKTIESIDAVQSASVTLTIPHDTVFVGATEDKPTAAVLVKTSGTLPNDTVLAISHLVASSIPNMNVDDVTVADANGNVLHAPGMDTSGAGGSQIEQKTVYEDAVAKKIDDMIARTLGPGHAAVTVSADLDTSKSNSVSTTYKQPTNASATGGAGTPVTIPLKQNNTAETLTGPGATGSNGVLGVGNNAGAGTATTAAGTNYKKTTTQQENGVDTTQVTAETPPGLLKRMSVSAVLDSAVVTTPEDVTKWTNQIEAAAGIVPARDGAQALQVTTVAFDKAAQKEAEAKLSSSGGGNAMFDLIKHFLTLLMIALVLFFAWRAIKRAETNRVPLRVPLDIRELELPAGAVAALEGGGGVPAMAGARRPIEAASSFEDEISELIERQPDEVAQTLRSWLADRRA